VVEESRVVAGGDVFCLLNNAKCGGVDHSHSNRDFVAPY